MQFSAGGILQNIELNGPADLDVWSYCYDVLQNSLFMMDAVSLGPLMAYSKMIRGYMKRYGTSVWHVLYQADVRMRLEQMTRIFRRLKSDYHAKDPEAKKYDHFDPSRPWNHVWHMATEDAQWWRHEFEEPALLLINRSMALQNATGDGAKVGSRNNVVADVSNQAGIIHVRPAPGGGGGAPGGGKGKKREWVETSLSAFDPNGNYTKNHKGYAICAGFNAGTCNHTQRGIWCSVTPETVHVCSKCLGTHPVSQCPQTGTGQGNRNTRRNTWWNKGGKGGKGKGAKGGKGKQQF